MKKGLKVNRLKGIHFSICLGLFIVSILAYAVWNTTRSTVHSSVLALNALSIALLLVYTYGVYAWVRVSKRIISPFLVFWLSCFAFNAGQVVLHVFRLPVHNWYDVYAKTPTDLLSKAILYQIMCLAGVLFGAIIATKRKDIIKNPYYQGRLLIHKNAGIDFVDIFFGVVTAVTFIVSIIELKNRISNGYGDSGTVKTSFYVVIYIFNILLFYELYRHSTKGWNFILIIIGLLRAVFLFLSGARYSTVPVLVGMASVLLLIKNEKLNLKWWQIIVIIGVILIGTSLLRGWTILRQYPLSSIRLEMIMKVYSSGLYQGFFDTIAETGNCLQPLTKTIELIDKGYGKGESTILYTTLLDFIPKSIVDKIYKPTITSLSGWITTKIGVKDGQGFSIFAEAYYNMGGFGFVFMFVYGFIYSKAENLMISLFQSDRIWYTLLGCAFLFLLLYETFLARADLILMSSYVRFCLYIFIVIVISQKGKIKKHIFKRGNL